MNKLAATIIASILVLMTVSAQAYEVHEGVCATYKNTGATYTVDAHEYTGSELNEATNSYDYWSHSTYIVIFWSNGTTIIEDDTPFESVTGVFGFDGQDQNGYPWNVQDTFLCY